MCVCVLRGEFISPFLQEEKDMKYGSGIFLIRNPFHATVSNWQRKLSKNHVGVIGQEHFGKHGPSRGPFFELSV